MNVRRLSLSAALIAMLCGECLAETNVDVVPFNSESSIGTSISTLINLMIWRTMRKIDDTGRPLGDARLRWDTKPLAVGTHEEAVRRSALLHITAPIMVWGHAYELPAGAAVTSFVTLPLLEKIGTIDQYFRPDHEQHERWRFVDTDINLTLEAELPEQVFEFRTIVLRREFYESYRTPDSLLVYALPSLNSQVLGAVGNALTRLGGAGDFDHVQFTDKEKRKKTGWVYLPRLTDSKWELVDFVGALIRYYRTDWSGALSLFGNVLENPGISVGIEKSTLKFMIRAKSELGEGAAREILRLLALDPYDKNSVEHVAMYKLRSCIGDGAVATFVRQLRRLRAAGNDCIKDVDALVQENSSLFASDDPWLTAWRQI